MCGLSVAFPVEQAVSDCLKKYVSKLFIKLKAGVVTIFWSDHSNNIISVEYCDYKVIYKGLFSKHLDNNTQTRGRERESDDDVGV